MATNKLTEAKLKQASDIILAQLTDMARIASECLHDAYRSLSERNGQLAYSVILRDQDVDEKEQEIDRLCLEYILRQQPVASHLRLVYATMKINPSLERIGDYAESIAKQSLIINSLNLELDLAQFQQLADVAIPMVSQAVKAFTECDEALAWKTIEQEEVANRIRDDINVMLYDLRERSQIPLEALTPLITVARRLERVSDQAKNICEEALYLATGNYMKHQSNEVFRVLFVDRNNAKLSQMAEGIANHLQLQNFVFSSAGLTPQPVDAGIVSAMAEKGCDINNAMSKSVEQIPNFEHYHVIVALCSEAKTVFPNGPTKTIGVEWSTADLEQDGAFDAAFQFLNQHITDLTQAILGQEKNKHE